MTANPHGETPPFRWLTYEEAGALMGLDPESVRKRATRYNAKRPDCPLWKRQPGNQAGGPVRVAVPEEAIPDPNGDPEEAIRRAAEGDARQFAALVTRLLDERAELAGRLDRISGAIEIEILRLVRPGSAARRMSRHTVAGKLRRIREAATA